MTNSKAELRKLMQERRLRMDPVYARGAAERIAGRVMALSEFRSARTVLCYLAMKHEVNTDAILEVVWQSGKKLAVPALGPDGEYHPAWVHAADRLVESKFGVREPGTPEWADGGLFDVLILPGVVFSPAGGRIGHGRGYIDRMLARLGTGSGCRIGLCFQSQMAESVPVCEHDVVMDVVVTEEAVFRGADRQGGMCVTATGHRPDRKGDAICGSSPR